MDVLSCYMDKDPAQVDVLKYSFWKSMGLVPNQIVATNGFQQHAHKMGCKANDADEVAGRYRVGMNMQRPVKAVGEDSMMMETY